MRAALADVATALGTVTVTNEDLQAHHPSWNMEAVARATGVVSRRIASEEETALDLAEAACRGLFARHPDLAVALDLLVFCTQTADRLVPANACLLQGRLGLPESVGAFDLGAACSGYVYGLAVAEGMVAAGRVEHVLLVTADTYSKILDPDDRSTRSLFGDGASATWLRPASGLEGVIDLIWATRGEAAASLQTVPARWAADASASAPVIDMDGRAVLAFSYGAVPQQVHDLLARNDLTVDDVDVFAFHQASALVLRGIQEQLGLPAEKVPQELATVGNTVSTSIPLLLEALRSAGTVRPGTLAVLSGFGAGLSWASALIRF